jgi:hypothetical protein
MFERVARRPSRGYVVGKQNSAYLALFVALATGSAWAAATIGANDIQTNAIRSRHIKAGAVKTNKIADRAVTTDKLGDFAVTGVKVEADTLTGNNIDESTLGQVPDSALLNGRPAGTFLSSSLYRNESPIGPGTLLGDGTYYIDEGCQAGDQLLSGGPANIRSTSTLLESFPGSTNSWRARINKNAQTDDFSVVVLCANQ